MGTSRKCFRQSGVVLPLLAVVIAGVLAVLIVVGLDASKVKKASSELSQLTEIVCRTVGAQATIHKDALERFSAAVDYKLDDLKHIKLIRAKLTIPTMPGDGDFPCRYGEAACASALPFVNSETRFSALGISNCKFGCDGLPGCEPDCVFQGSITGGVFPSRVWDNRWNAGNTAACELSGVVEGWLRPTKTISAKSMWWIPVRGDFNYAPDSTDVPGMIMAVAPHMTTRATDGRFLFCSAGEPACGTMAPPDNDYPGGDAAFRAAHDPLYNFGTASETRAFRGTPAEQAYPGGPMRIVSPDEINDNPQDRREMLTACMNPAILIRNVLLGTIMEYASRHGQLRRGTEVLLAGTQARYPRSYGANNESTARANPVRLVPFGEDIALKSYQMPFVFYDGAFRRDPLGDPAVPAPPVKGLRCPPGTSHCTESEHWPSYLPEDALLPTQGGLLDPFVSTNYPAGTFPRLVTQEDSGQAEWYFSNPGTRTTLERYHALLANQLRYCYHMYDADSLGSGKSRPDVMGVANVGFEPEARSPFPFYFSDVPYRAVDPALRNLRFNPVGNFHWDQQSPWGGAMSRTRLLDASELMWAMGSIQKCPYEYQGAFHSDLESDICTKPASISSGIGNATFDLRPDIYGILMYAAAQDPVPPGYVNYYLDNAGARVDFDGRFQAVKSPGLFPLNYTAGLQSFHKPPVSPVSDPWHPFGLTDHTGRSIYYPSGDEPAVNPLAHVFIMTHQKLGDGEAERIRLLVCGTTNPAQCLDTAPLFNRPITVVYMPVDEYESTNHAQNAEALENSIQRFQYAFNVPYDQSSSGNSRTSKALFVLSPYLPRYCGESPNHGNAPDVIDPPPYGHPEVWQRYRAYWHDLLTDPMENIDMIARNIFYSRILMQDIKF